MSSFIKQIRYTISVFIFLLLLCLSISAQNGSLTMEITDATSDNPQVASQMEMMKGTKVGVTYKGQQSMTKMDMMGGMVKVDVKMSESGDMDMYMDMMGQKMWIVSTKAEMDLAKAESGASEPEISYDESDTKMIAGFECYKMVLTSPDNEDFTLEAYITEKIKTNAAVIQNVDISKFKGFPLEYTINMPQMQMTFETTDYSAEIDESIFDVNTDGYKKMTFEEFQSAMGGMGGFGF